MVFSKGFLINIGFKPDSGKIMYSALRDVQMNQKNDASILEDRRVKHDPEHKPTIQLFVSRSCNTNLACQDRMM